MTTVTIKKGTEAWRTEISVRGHADYNPGNDIVCSAISSSICMLLNFLMQMDEQAMHTPKILDYGKLIPGDVDMTVSQMGCDKTEKTKIKTAIECFRIAIAQVEQEYPMHVKLEVIK